MIWLTNSLFVGEREEIALSDDIYWAESPGVAVRIIEEGANAMLPRQGDWEERVSDTLALLGANSEHIAWVLRWARRVTPEEAPSEG